MELRGTKDSDPLPHRLGWSHNSYCLCLFTIVIWSM